jgi:hypothetical protein
MQKKEILIHISSPQRSGYAEKIGSVAIGINASSSSMGGLPA